MGFYIADGEQRFRTPTSRERRVRKPQKKSSLASACGRSVLEACAGGYSGRPGTASAEARRALGERLSESPARMRFTAVSAAESSWSHQQSLISVLLIPWPRGLPAPISCGNGGAPPDEASVFYRLRPVGAQVSGGGGSFPLVSHEAEGLTPCPRARPGFAHSTGTGRVPRAGLAARSGDSRPHPISQPAAALVIPLSLWGRFCPRGHMGRCLLTFLVVLTVGRLLASGGCRAAAPLPCAGGPAPPSAAP